MGEQKGMFTIFFLTPLKKAFFKKKKERNDGDTSKEHGTQVKELQVKEQEMENLTEEIYNVVNPKYEINIHVYILM